MLIERALDMGEALGLPEILVFGWGAKGVLAATRGRRQESRMLLSAAVEIALEHGFMERAGVGLGNLSDQAFAVDRYEEALGHLARVLELARKSGDRPNEWFAHSESTYGLFQLGRWDEAMAAFAELPREQLPSGHTLISPLTSILEIHLNRGQVDDARKLLEIFSRLPTSFDVQERVGYAGAAAAIAYAEGRYADALELGEQSVAARGLLGDTAQAVKQGLRWAAEAAYALGRMDRLDEILQIVEHRPPGLRSPMMEAHAHRLRARLADGVAEADAAYAAAERLFEGLGLVFWLAVARLEHAEARLAHGGDASRLADEARTTFVQLGARPWLERVAAVDGGAVRAAVPDVAG
jgi:tetratricopeptide (TPR) repeat protein